MSPEEIAENYTYLYHMSEEGSWPSIRQHGLLSTSALLDLFEANEEERRLIELAHRPESVTLIHPKWGTAVIRDQKPLSPSKLRGCLQGGMSEKDWYRLLNGKVFFWACRERLAGLMAARAYRNRRHTVVAVDGEALTREYKDRMWVTTMNTGTTAPMAHPRGRESFTKLLDFDLATSRRRRGRKRAVVEIAIDYAVPDIAKFVVRVEHLAAGTEPELIYSR